MHDVDPELTFDVEALLPEDYVTDVGVRLSLYKRLASAVGRGARRRSSPPRWRTASAPPPDEARRLVKLMALKTELRRLRALGCEANARVVTLHLREDTPLDPAKITALIRKTRGAWKLTPDMRLSRRFAAAATASRTRRRPSPSSRAPRGLMYAPPLRGRRLAGESSKADGKAGRMTGWANQPSRPPVRPRTPLASERREPWEPSCWKLVEQPAGPSREDVRGNRDRSEVARRAPRAAPGHVSSSRVPGGASPIARAFVGSPSFRRDDKCHVSQGATSAAAVRVPGCRESGSSRPDAHGRVAPGWIPDRWNAERSRKGTVGGPGLTFAHNIERGACALHGVKRSERSSCRAWEWTGERQAPTAWLSVGELNRAATGRRQQEGEFERAFADALRDILNHERRRAA